MAGNDTRTDEPEERRSVLGRVDSILTNVEADHLDHFGTLEAIHESFASYLDRIEGPRRHEARPQTPVVGGTKGQPQLTACRRHPLAIRIAWRRWTRSRAPTP